MPAKRSAPMASTTGPKPKRSRPTFREVKPSVPTSSSADAASSSQISANDSILQSHLPTSKEPKFRPVKASPSLGRESGKASQETSTTTEVITFGTTAKGRRNHRM